MPYILPDDVISPQNSWTLNCVIYDEGAGGIAISLGEWKSEDGTVSQVIGMRWNGNNDPHKGLGNPQSSGHATWFILPHEIGIITLKEILVKQAAGNTNIRTKNISTAINWLKNIGKINPTMYES